ncbi:MAG: hypothetical protein KUL82_08925 [Bdellovibrio sp.]|nr:hypothetical protein [Bdellovibrio sp.]
MVERGGLYAINEARALDGFEGIFDFGFGAQEYLLRGTNGTFEAIPSEGGDVILNADLANLVYETAPSKMLGIELAKAGFVPTSPVAGQSAQVLVWQREFAGDQYRIITVLDDQVVQTHQFLLWLKELKNRKNVIVFGSEKASIAICSTVPDIDVGDFILSQFSEDVLTWIAANTDAQNLPALYPDMDLIVRVETASVFFKGKQVKIKKEGKPIEYIVGCSKLEGDMTAGKFGDKFLGVKEYLGPSAVNTARSELKKALKLTFTDATDLEYALNILVSERENNTVSSKLKEVKFVVIE